MSPRNREFDEVHGAGFRRADGAARAARDCMRFNASARRVQFILGRRRIYQDVRGFSPRGRLAEMKKAHVGRVPFSETTAFSRRRVPRCGRSRDVGPLAVLQSPNSF
jgi:hypothetical protein